MNKYKEIFRGKSLVKGLMAGMLILPFASCNDSFIFEHEGDCDPHYYVKYVFDMNMNWADAFPAQVHSVNLYVIDANTGEVVETLTETSEVLDQPGYRMPLDVPPGEYELVAWCGLDNNQDHFVLPNEIKKKEDLHVTMDRNRDAEGNAVQNECLTPLFHGMIKAELPDHEGEYEYTIYLTKDTNNINISLQHISGMPLSSDMFTVTMVEGNGHMAHDNSLIKDEDVKYTPWTITDGIVDGYGHVETVGTDAPEHDREALNYFKAELSTARLMADRDPQIVITDNETGNVVYSIPLVQWCKAFRSERYKDMSDQEYLDREDEYNIMLYLMHKEGWKAAQILINGWRVVGQGDSVMGS